jgi:hypothetical protein
VDAGLGEGDLGVTVLGLCLPHALAQGEETLVERDETLA